MQGAKASVFGDVSPGSDECIRDIGVDYDHLDECWAPIHALLDHACGVILSWGEDGPALPI